MTKAVKIVYAGDGDAIQVDDTGHDGRTRFAELCRKKE
jgi:hypothetical protein